MILITRRQKTIVTDPDEPLGRDMHQEPADEFFTGDGDFFPLSLVIVIFCSKGTLEDSNLEKILSLHKDNFSIDETTGKQAMTYEINNKKVSKERYAECYLKYIEDAQEVIYKEKR